MYSINTIRPISSPACNPSTVITGISEVRSTCRTITARSASPLARAVRTKSCDSVSSMPARAMRRTTGANVSASVSAGSTRRRTWPSGSSENATYPVAGNQCSTSPKTRTNTLPTTNDGNVRPSTDTPVIARSSGRPARRAASVPMGMPSSTAAASANTPSSSERGTRTASSAPMERPDRIEVPKSPRARCASQAAYCSMSWRSRPSACRMAAILSGDAAFSPSMTTTTSPGTARSSRNTAVAIAAVIAAAAIRRRRTYAPIGTPGGRRDLFREPRRGERVAGIRPERARVVIVATDVRARRLSLIAPRDVDPRRERERPFLDLRVELLADGLVADDARLVEPLVELRVLEPHLLRVVRAVRFVEQGEEIGVVHGRRQAAHLDGEVALVVTVQHDRPLGEIELRLDADLRQLRLEDLRGARVEAVGDGRQDRDPEPVAVASLAEQLARFVGPVRVHAVGVPVVRPPTRRDDVPGDRRAPAVEDRLDDGVPVDRVRDRLAHAHVVVRLPLRVEDDAHEDAHVRVEPQLGIPRDRVHLFLGHEIHQHDVPRAQRREARLRVGERHEIDRVEVRLAGFPIRLVAHQPDALAGVPGDELERPRAEHGGAQVRAALHELGVHDGPVGFREVGEQRRERLVEHDLDRH